MSLIQGDQTREFSALRQGIIDMAVGSTINWSPQVKELNLFSLPFLMPDYAAVDALTQGEVGKRSSRCSRTKASCRWPGARTAPANSPTRSTRSRRPADLKGMKIRVVGSPAVLRYLDAPWARIPTQMSWADAQPALATGAVDGQENPLACSPPKMHTVGQTYRDALGLCGRSADLRGQQQDLESWSEADRAAVREAAEQAAVEEIAMARKGLTAEDTSLIDQIKANGVEVVTLSEAEKQPFQEATKDVYAKWKKTVGEDLVTKAETAIAER